MAKTLDQKNEAQRTVSFFRLVIQDADHEHKQLPPQDWQQLLKNVEPWDIHQRTHTSPTRRLIGEVLTVDGDKALKLMEPRDENSWLEILKVASSAGGDTEAVDVKKIGQLVETTIVVFLPEKNLVGIIRGSTSSPTHTALAEWLDHLKISGKRLVPNEKQSLVAEPATAKSQSKKLAQADGVSMASVRMSTNKANQLEAVGATTLANTLKTLKKTYGNIFVTITLRVPSGNANAAAREELKREALRLEAVAGSAEAVSATLVTYDQESRAHSEEVNFVSQRITTKTQVPLTGDDGEPIRNGSAVRAILRAAHTLRGDLDSI